MATPLHVTSWLFAQAHFSCWLQDFVVPAWLSGSKPIGAAPSPPLTAPKEGPPSPSRLVRAGSIKQDDNSRKLAEPVLVRKDTIMRSGRLDTLYITFTASHSTSLLHPCKVFVHTIVHSHICPLQGVRSYNCSFAHLSIHKQLCFVGMHCTQTICRGACKVALHLLCLMTLSF